MKLNFTSDFLGSDSDRGVSPVIGVILMVAITVILAAVIGAFVLDIGGSQETTPTANFDFEYDSSSNTVTVTHSGGDTIPAEDTVEVVGGASTETFSGSISTGDSVTVDVTGEETLRVVWTSESGDTSSELNTYEVPNIEYTLTIENNDGSSQDFEVLDSDGNTVETITIASSDTAQVSLVDGEYTVSDTDGGDTTVTINDADETVTFDGSF